MLDAETVPAIDVTAVNMLTALAGDLRRDGVELVLARDVAVVRELARLGTTGDGLLRTYPTVRDAVGAMSDGANGS